MSGAGREMFGQRNYFRRAFDIQMKPVNNSQVLDLDSLIASDYMKYMEASCITFAKCT
jgi:hypothetical protein